MKRMSKGDDARMRRALRIAGIILAAASAWAVIAHVGAGEGRAAIGASPETWGVGVWVSAIVGFVAGVVLIRAGKAGA